MNSAAIYLGSVVIRWPSVMIFFGILSCLFMTLALYSPKNRSTAAVWIFTPLAVFFSVFLSRLFHWYFNMEQYTVSFGEGTFASFSRAFSDFSSGSYCLPGVILGIMLAAGIVSLLGFCSGAGRFLDFAAPGTALLIAFTRLSAFFTLSCIGKRPINASFLKHLPFSVPVTDAAGTVSYRLAVFFIEFLLMIAVFFLVLAFFSSFRNSVMYAPCKSSGNVWKIFLVLYSIVEILTDSLRTDSPLMHFTYLTSLNAYSAFISFAQVAGVLFLLWIFIYYFVCSVRSGGFRWKHAVFLLVFLVSLAGIGYFGEYSIQRYGRTGSGYLIMIVSLLAAGTVCTLLYQTCAPEPDFYE